MLVDLVVRVLQIFCFIFLVIRILADHLTVAGHILPLELVIGLFLVLNGLLLPPQIGNVLFVL